ncbi:MAG TPA: hypothetical protein VH597_03755 [Verrucomicrobiae bacterium]|jgi:hypothetical protein|nr:hypothetical protein [Verrucomicrobiae bacterium]
MREQLLRPAGTMECLRFFHGLEDARLDKSAAEESVPLVCLEIQKVGDEDEEQTFGNIQAAWDNMP